jgi:hypothetical protein
METHDFDHRPMSDVQNGSNMMTTNISDHRREELLKVVSGTEAQLAELLSSRNVAPAEIWYSTECDDSLCNDESEWLLSAQLGYAQIEGRWHIAFREQAIEQESGMEITAPARPFVEACLRLLMYLVPTPSAEQLFRTIEATQ